ncbi:Dynactin subunit 1 [Papilio machaon]|uniref:Dynactin subunit 1 n=1 Tax=Papilio machaon TaxID=76193 RepID=A0A0N1PJW7_PAPMA|nr:Dynactin subunit 1 [Papilio machaon]
MTDKVLSLGQRVILVAKDVKGTVAYVGYPTFASGRWVGVILDEPKGKNNGTLRGHAYFRCEDNYGVFVRPTQIQLLDGDDNPVDMTTSTEEPSILKSSSNRRLSSSRTSLASSRQSLTSYTSPTTERATSPDLTKRASFVETNFVETLTPQYTPGQSLTSPQPAPNAVEDKLANMQAQQEITNLKSEVEDLKEKLETLRVRRAEDREKIRELERLRLQLDQANEFKTKIMESKAQLQRDLQRAKQEVREAQEALEAHNEETAELQEAAEMAALDKEMAEERAEALQMELEQCRDKLEEATLDLQLMRAEMEAGGNIQLEALQEVHEQLVESNRELEMDLREELEMAHAATREAVREREAAMETIMDRDATIVKFRELVHKMTEQYNELRAQLDTKQESPPRPEQQESSPEVRASPPELGSLVQASRASTRSVDLQLRALELAQAKARADMLAACLPDHFMSNAGESSSTLSSSSLSSSVVSSSFNSGFYHHLTVVSSLFNSGFITHLTVVSIII